eukprot:bmy_14651T0
MAPEESAEAAPLLRSFERRFLAARALRSFPWQVGGGERGRRVGGRRGRGGAGLRPHTPARPATRRPVLPRGSRHHVRFPGHRWGPRGLAAGSRRAAGDHAALNLATRSQTPRAWVFSSVSAALDKAFSEAADGRDREVQNSPGKRRKSSLPCPGDLPFPQRRMAEAAAAFFQGQGSNDTASFIIHNSSASLEEKLRDSSGSELLLDILQKMHKGHPGPEFQESDNWGLPCIHLKLMGDSRRSLSSNPHCVPRHRP